jgi:hypothetical protein
MNNNIEQASTLLDDVDYRTLNVLGILRNVTKGLRKIHTTFEGFSLFDLATEQIISRVNMFFQHYHLLTNLSRKLDASLGYLQLQIRTPHNPFTMDYSKWGYLAPLSWVKMLWKLLHHFEITLHMSFPDIALPGECHNGNYHVTGPGSREDKMDQQMQGISKGNLPLGHNNGERKVPRALCH